MLQEKVNGVFGEIIAVTVENKRCYRGTKRLLLEKLRDVTGELNYVRDN